MPRYSVTVTLVLPPVLRWQLQIETEPVSTRASDGTDEQASKPSFAEEMRAKEACYGATGCTGENWMLC